MKHTIRIEPTGKIRSVYNDTLPFARWGRMEVARASTVEFNTDTQQWEVRWAKTPETVSFSHASRDTCINWEVQQLNESWSPQSKK